MTYTDKELREEFQNFADSIVWSNDDGSEKYIGVGNMADWWLKKIHQAIAEERERVRGEIEKIKLLPYYAKLCQNRNGMDYCGTCEQAWGDCSCSARNTGHKKGVETVLHLLSSLDKPLTDKE